MNKLKTLSALFAMLLLSACGGGSDGCTGGTIAGDCAPIDGSTPNAALVASLILVTSSPQLTSDQNGNNTVVITAVVQDAIGNLLSDVPVTFGTDTGALGVVQPVTDASGQAIATISGASNPTNRTINVSAQAGSGVPAVDGLTINVVGTTLTLAGPATIGIGDSADYTATLTDGALVGISGEAITVTVSATAPVNGISPAIPVTALDGVATFALQANRAGADNITVTALGLSENQDINVTNDQFAFVPLGSTDITLNTNQTLDLEWIATPPISDGTTVNFNTTRGTLSANSSTTIGGIASVDIQSNNSGPAVVTATDPATGITATINLEFIATDAATMNVQASPTTVTVGAQSVITAQVLDASNNLIKGQDVTFVLTDTTGGQISSATAITDSFGIARITYTGGNTPSSPDEVSIQAWTLGPGPVVVADTATLTVAGVAATVTIGTGNTLVEIPDSTFAREWIIIVKDGVGNPVPDADVEVRLLPTQYAKGWFSLPDPVTEPLLEGWIQRVQAVCANEDPFYTGIISDPSVMDINNNGVIDPGTDAVVAGVDPNAPPGNACTFAGYGVGGAAADVKTNSNGLARVCVYYPENFALWIELNIEARTLVSGTEFSANDIHWPWMSADDRNNETATPANWISPYGVANVCSDPL